MMATAVHACSPAIPHVVIEGTLDTTLLTQEKQCLDEHCIFLLENLDGYFSIKRTDKTDAAFALPTVGNVTMEDSHGSVNIEYVFVTDPSIAAFAFFDALDKLFIDEVEEIAPVFFAAVEEWRSNDRGYFLSGNLVFSPYTEEKREELAAEKRSLMNCTYREYNKVGSWLVTRYTTREYCHRSGGGGGMCPGVAISYPQFISFLISNLNSETAQYLLPLGIFFLVTLIFIGYLIFRKEVWKFFRPTRSKVTVFLAYSVLVYVATSFVAYGREHISALPAPLVAGYITISVVEYIGRRIRTRT